MQSREPKNAQIFYFLNLHRSHVLDLLMQGLWIKTQSSPFEAPYFSCVPYLLGEGQAMQYSFWPKSDERTPIPRLPLRPPDDYLRDAMVKSLATADVEFDFASQLQTDPFLMPIENNAVLWPEKLSPRVSVATLRHSQADIRLAGADGLRETALLQPVALHRRTSAARQSEPRPATHVLGRCRSSACMNAVPHYEPTGDEVFD